ncbi:MAG: CotH kinase family protein [Polyangiales bacterium]
MAVAEQRRAPSRPSGWSDSSHGERADADYARIFRDDRVQRIDIEITPDVAESLDDDLSQRIGPLGSPASAPAAVEACAGRSQNAACSFLEVEGGRCINRGRLTCRGPDQEVAIDMVPGDPVMVPVTVRYDGKVWTRVGFRYKGNSSLSRPWTERIRKLPFRLDFDKFEDEHPELKNQRFYGFDKLTFASAYGDPSFIREKLAFDMLRDAGLAAARASFYRVYVDAGDGPKYWGVYTVVEDPSDVLPRARFADGSGNVYKPDGTGADFTRFDVRGFEKKSNEEAADYGDVQRAISALNGARDDAAAWRRRLEQTIDVEAFLGNHAVRMAVDHWDGYGQLAHNYYLYGDPDHGGRLVFLSWDHNSTWGARARTSILPESLSSRWPLIRNTLSDSVYRARYLARLRQFVEGPYEKSRFDAYASKLHALVAPYVVGDGGERAPFTHLRATDTFQQALGTIVAAADSRRAEIRRALASGEPTRNPPSNDPSNSDAPADSETPVDSDLNADEASYPEEDSYEDDYEYESEEPSRWRFDDPRWQLIGE